jgi:hypothetical protein
VSGNERDVRVAVARSEEETLLVCGCIEPPAAGLVVELRIAQNGHSRDFMRETDGHGWFALEVSEYELEVPVDGDFRVEAVVQPTTVSAAGRTSKRASSTSPM